MARCHISAWAILVGMAVLIQLAASEAKGISGKRFKKPKTGLPAHLSNLKRRVPPLTDKVSKRRCGSKETRPTKYQARRLNAAVQRVNSTLPPVKTIEVYVHNRYYTSGGSYEGHITYDQVVKQIDVLNKGFAGQLRATINGLQDDGTKGPANTRIVFKLAAAYDWPTSIYSEFSIVEGSITWNNFRTKAHMGGCDTLNLFIHKANTDGYTLLGVATFPWECGWATALDGVFVDYRFVPGGSFRSSTSIGRTAVHEAGHWAGLYHVFYEYGGCVVNRDGVSDTPDGTVTKNSCPTTVPDNCIGSKYPGLNPIRNFMDYTDENCIWKFTPGQAARVYASCTLFRSN